MGDVWRTMNVPDDAVLFDMDGVLVDSEDYWHEFEDEFVFAEAIESGSPDHEEITGMNFREIYDYLSEEYGTTVTKETFVGAYDDRAQSLYGEQVTLMDGAESLFDDLGDAGRTLAIVSSAPQSWIGIVRDRFDLEPLDLVLSADDIDAPGKPEPHIYEHAAAELGFDPASCVVVEDSVNGIESAVSAGAFTVAYRRAHNDELDLSRADVVAEGPEALRDVLLG
jgi:HAD superfamily hydrolase (TIGR01509 family)